MSEQTKADVLAVLDLLIAFAARGVEHDDPARLLIEASNKARADVADLINVHKWLYRAYVQTLEAGSDRIASLGGACDPVDVMERNDPALVCSRRIIARIGGAP